MPERITNSSKASAAAPGNSKGAAQPSTQAPTQAARDAAIRAAKQRMRDITRNDWTFDPEHNSSRPPSPPYALDREATEWRYRDPGSSCDSDVDQTAEISDNAYADDQNRRRKKRRKMLIEEMDWNHGLRIWAERRDAWTGARCGRPPATSDSDIDDTDDGATSGDEDEDEDDFNMRSIDAQDISAATAAGFLKPVHHPSSSKSSEESKRHSHLHHASCSCPSAHRDWESAVPLDDPVLPIAPPLFPATNIIRASISPAIYPQIYSKVIIQGLTPSIPINLADVTRALVCGWKSEGQWPPKDTIPEPTLTAVKKRSPAATGGFRRALGLDGGSGHSRN